MGKGYVPYLDKGLKFFCGCLVLSVMTNPCKTGFLSVFLHIVVVVLCSGGMRLPIRD